MHASATMMLALVTAVALLTLAGGIALVRRPTRAEPSPSTTLSLAGATTMSPRLFGWWLIGTSLILLTLSGYLVTRFYA